MPRLLFCGPDSTAGAPSHCIRCSAREDTSQCSRQSQHNVTASRVTISSSRVYILFLARSFYTGVAPPILSLVYLRFFCYLERNYKLIWECMHQSLMLCSLAFTIHNNSIQKLRKLTIIFSCFSTVLRRVRKLRKAIISFIMSSRLSAWNNSALIEQTFMKYGI